MRVRAIGVSVIGVLHKREGSPIGDYWGFKVGDKVVEASMDSYVCSEGFTGETPYLLIAVADGAGSAEKGFIGAREAVRAALQVEVQPDFEGERVVQQAFIRAVERLESLSEGSRDVMREYATTLAVVYVNGKGECYGANVGDTFAVTLDGNGELRLFLKPVKGEYFNETEFITMEDVVETIKRGIKVEKTACRGVAVLTDGLWPVISAEPGRLSPYPKFFKPLFSSISSMDPKKLAESLARMLEKREDLDDDKTLVAAVTEDDVVEGGERD